MASSRKAKIGFFSVVGMICVALALGVIYWAFRKPPEKAPPPSKGLPRMANLPTKPAEEKPPPPPYSPNAPLLEEVRKALRKGITPSEAVRMARSLPERPERPDAAFLLLEYAADSGDSDAALAVGKYYDPSYDGPSGTIIKNPITAYEWYQEALKGGRKEAHKRLSALRVWAERNAAEGSEKARRLLNAWR